MGGGKKGVGNNSCLHWVQGTCNVLVFSLGNNFKKIFGFILNGWFLIDPCLTDGTTLDLKQTLISSSK